MGYISGGGRGQGSLFPVMLESLHLGQPQIGHLPEAATRGHKSRLLPSVQDSFCRS